MVGVFTIELRIIVNLWNAEGLAFRSLNGVSRNFKTFEDFEEFQGFQDFGKLGSFETRESRGF